MNRDAPGKAVPSFNVDIGGGHPHSSLGPCSRTADSLFLDLPFLNNSCLICLKDRILIRAKNVWASLSLSKTCFLPSLSPPSLPSPSFIPLSFPPSLLSFFLPSSN